MTELADSPTSELPVAQHGLGSFSPALMLEIELTHPLPEVKYNGKSKLAWAMVRLHGEPVGACILPVTEEGLTPSQVGAQLWSELRQPVVKRFAEAGLPEPEMLGEGGLETGSVAWPYLLKREATLAAAPFISVVICTRDRVDQLKRCLSYVDKLQYPDFEVVVVDNAPSSDAAQVLIEERPGKVPYRYVVEPRGGLSWARNAGISAASGDIIAFLDDDEAPDSYWLVGLAGGFDRGDDIGCVTGLIAPSRLDTDVQWWFELVGGHSKGRGFSADVFASDGPQSPLYPLPPFGAGGNMAFRREALERIGGFDVALGAGTPAKAAEDTLALTLVLLSGYRIAYEPAALVHHDHYADIAGLARQLHGYGVGITAFYTALLRHRPSVFPGLLRLAVVAVGYFTKEAKDTVEIASLKLPEEFKRFRNRHHWGMLSGPVAYGWSMCKQYRVERRAIKR